MNWHNHTSYDNPDLDSVDRPQVEHRWKEAKRPYYNLWPTIAESFLKMPLKVDCAQIRLPLYELLVRFAVGHEPAMPDGGKLAAVLFAEGAMEHAPERRLIVALQSYVEGDVGCCTLELTAGLTIEEAVRLVHPNLSEDSGTQCLRIACMLCLLRNDPDLIEPDVLRKDRPDYERTLDPKYVDKAVRRGKVGWNVGAKIEVNPHWRRPHFSIRWTGKGRTIPVVTPIKGAMIKRQKLTEVPTGYLDSEHVA